MEIFFDFFVTRNILIVFVNFYVWIATLAKILIKTLQEIYLLSFVQFIHPPPECEFQCYIPNSTNY